MLARYIAKIAVRRAFVEFVTFLNISSRLVSSRLILNTSNNTIVYRSQCDLKDDDHSNYTVLAVR